MKDRAVSEAVVRRLLKYYRVLNILDNKGVDRISSGQLGKRTGFTASQIRQDLNYFGGFGQQGYGYHIKTLKNEISSIFGLDRKYSMVVIGAGNIGQALAGYPNFSIRGFNISAIFDNNPAIIGKHLNNILVRDISELKDFAKENCVDIGIIATPAGTTEMVAAQLKEAGIKSILNFSPYDLFMEGIIVENINLIDSLYTLGFKMKNGNRFKKSAESEGIND